MRVFGVQLIFCIGVLWGAQACTDDGGEKGDGTEGEESTGGDGDADGDSDGDADSDAPEVPSEGCGVSAMGSGSHSLTVDDVERTFVLDLPTDYDNSTAYPVIFGFHGMGGSGEMFRSSFYGNLLSAMADEVIVVHPDAIGDPTAWDTGTDVPFFDALLEHLESSLCVDETRVFITGHSSGGFFSNTLACQRGNVIRGAAPVSGGGPFVFGGTSCQGQVAAWIAHGENDDTVDISSGEGSRDFWADANSCDIEEVETVTPAECVEYGGCDAGYPVRWCVYQDGHNWPDFAPEGMWSFFKAL
jgi:poly(3-hydroxybutyrate) depolymerase